MRGFFRCITIGMRYTNWNNFKKLFAVACYLYKLSVTNSICLNKVSCGNGNKQGKADATGKAYLERWRGRPWKRP